MYTFYTKLCKWRSLNLVLVKQIVKLKKHIRNTEHFLFVKAEFLSLTIDGRRFEDIQIFNTKKCL